MHKFVMVSMVMLLVLGLGLAACGAPTEIQPPPTSQPEQPAAPPSQPEQPSAPPSQPAAPPSQPEQPSAPPAAKQLTYEAKTYTNSQYGFSVQYPKEWVERSELINKTVVAAFGVAAAIPGISISVADADGPLTADWIVAQTNSLPDTSEGKVTSDIAPTTLDDGTSAFQYTLEYKYQMFAIKSFGVAADKDGKRIRAWVWTIDSFSPYDETLFSEITHTLSFK
jgi:hypothetical protein